MVKSRVPYPIKCHHQSIFDLPVNRLLRLYLFIITLKVFDSEFNKHFQVVRNWVIFPFVRITSNIAIELFLASIRGYGSKQILGIHLWGRWIRILLLNILIWIIFKSFHFFLGYNQHWNYWIANQVLNVWFQFFHCVFPCNCLRYKSDWMI